MVQVSNKKPISEGKGMMMKTAKDKPVLEGREKTDRRIVLFFIFWVILLFSLVIIGGTLIGEIGLDSVIPALLGSLTFAFFFTGFLAFKYHRKRWIIPTKRIWIWFARISLVIGLVFAVGMYWLLTQTVILNDPPVEGSTAMMIAMFIGLFIGGFAAGFLGQVLIMIMGFGMIGVISAIVRNKTPDLLVEITKITPNITDSVKKKDKKTYRGFIWLGWAFNIPDVLDTQTLTIDRGSVKKKFPWPIFKKAVLLQLFFGIIIVAYISFSPFLLDIADMSVLFSTATGVSNFIPIFILPWFIYLRLDAKIKGPVKDFKLFDGLYSRMFQTLVAFSTLILIFRMAVRDPVFWDVMANFTSYIIFFTIGIFIFTFVYFNYFNEDLAIDIAEKYEKMKD